MGLKCVKWAYSGVYLSQTMWNHAKKINEKAQTANFSVLARGRRPRKELFDKNMKTRETNTQITQHFEKV